MPRLACITPRFVEAVPKTLDDGVLYISETYGTASHNCACGCGARVVTPLTPTDWKVVREKGGTVSVYPSIGNSDYPCESHYWIRRNKIVWAPKLSQAEIEAGRELNRAQRAAYFSTCASSQRNWLDKLVTRIRSLFR